MSRLILGSSSKSRIEILKNHLGLVPNVVLSPDVDEVFDKTEDPRLISFRLANEKMQKVIKTFDYQKGDVAITADTVVAKGRRVVDKALNDDDVRRSLNLLSGCNHRIYTTVCVSDFTDVRTRTVETRIKFKHFSTEDIEFYVKSGEGIGKAGGYGISGLAESFVINIIGSSSNVIGLPSYQTANLLKSFGFCKKF